MYNLIEYSETYLKTSGSLLYHRYELALDTNSNIIDFPANNNNSTSFKFKQSITDQTRNGGIKDVEIIFGEHLKYLLMVDGRDFFDEPVKMIQKHMITLKRLQQVKVMITK